MSGFSNPLNAGETLILDSLHSPNYVPDVSGWTINKDGSAEFNDLTIRGTVIIEGSNAILIYAGVPATGNLMLAIAGQNGTDPFGNDYFAGMTLPDDVSGAITFSDPGGTLLSGGVLSSGSIGQVILKGPYAVLGQVAELLLQLDGSNQGVAALQLQPSGTALVLQASGVAPGAGPGIIAAGNVEIQNILTVDGYVDPSGGFASALHVQDTPAGSGIAPVTQIGKGYPSRYSTRQYTIPANQAGFGTAYKSVAAWAPRLDHDDYAAAMNAGGGWTCPVSAMWNGQFGVLFTASATGQFGMRIRATTGLVVWEKRIEYPTIGTSFLMEAFNGVSMNAGTIYTFDILTPVGAGMTITPSNQQTILNLMKPV